MISSADMVQSMMRAETVSVVSFKGLLIAKILIADQIPFPYQVTSEDNVRRASTKLPGVVSVLF